MSERPSPDATLISIVLPVYNDAGTIRDSFAFIAGELSELDTNYEIIYVNNAANDTSRMVLDRLAEENDRVRVVHLARRSEREAAIRAGLTLSRGDAVVLMESWQQPVAGTMDRFVYQWREGYDVVFAAQLPDVGNTARRRPFDRFHRMLFCGGAIDESRFGLIDRRVVTHLLANSERAPYFSEPSLWVGFRQKKLGVEFSSHSRLGTALSRLDVLRLAMAPAFPRGFPQLVAFRIAAVLATFTFSTVGVYVLVGALLLGQSASVLIPGILTVAFFGSLNILGICLAAGYLARAYIQTHNPPLFPIDRIVNPPPRPEIGQEYCSGAIRWSEDGDVSELDQGDWEAGDWEAGDWETGDWELVNSDFGYSSADDAPYRDIMEQAVRLLETECVARDVPYDSDNSTERDDAAETTEPVILPYVTDQ